MASLNSLYQTYVRKCPISSCKKSNVLNLLNFQKRTYTTLHSSSSSFTWWRNCHNFINDFYFSRTDHNCLLVRNRPPIPFKRQHCYFSTKNFLHRHPMCLSPKVQLVRLYSERGRKDNETVPEISISPKGRPVLEEEEEEALSTTYRKVMKNVPQSIVLLTSAMFETETNSWLKRGVACSSLLSVSLQPPILSFCLNKPSRMHDLLLLSQQFAINILGKKQAKLIDLFSSPIQDGLDQFSGIPHHLSKEGIPVLADTPVLLCQTHSVHNVGDHSVWYGTVTGTLHENQMIEPILHYFGSYHNIGEKIGTLPRCVFTQGPVISRLAITWQCVKEHGLEGSLQCMKEMFEKQFESKERDWHETIAVFYLKNVSLSLEAEEEQQNPDQTFEEFLHKNDTLINLNDHLLQYYTMQLLSSQEAKEKYIPPDRKPFNGLH